MRVLHVMPVLGVGGASRLMTDIIPLMNKASDCYVDLLIGKCIDSTFMPILINSGIRVHNLNCSSLYNPRNILRLIKYLNNYDVIHVHLFPSLYWVALANFFVHRPIVYTEHSTTNKRRGKWYLRPLEKWVYKQYVKIISISDGTHENLKEWVKAGRDDKRFVVVNNGIKIESFKDCKHERIYLYTLIMVARFTPAKDQKTIIRAMALLEKDVHLILVGDGEKLEDCKELASQLSVGDRVHFVGTQSDIPSWIGKADIGIQSSHWEGFGLTAVEMMAGGLPVVASDVDGVKQVVDGAGVLFPHGDYEKLAEIVKKLLSDKSYYEAVKRKCIERSKMYDIKTMVDSYIRVYKEVIQNN